MKMARHAWLVITPLGEISLPFKAMKNIKIADPVLTRNSFCDQDNSLQKIN